MLAKFRTFILLPVIVVALVAIPTLVFGAANGHPVTAEVAAVGSSVENTVDQSVSQPPPPPPPGTVPHPPRPPRPPMPPAPPRPPAPHYNYAPAPTPTSVPSFSAAFIGNHRIERVIGDRLSSTIYAYTDDNGWLYRSDQNGMGWYLVTTSPQVDSFVMSAADPNVLFSGEGAACGGSAAGSVPMYKSTDGGQTWDVLPTGVNMRPVLADAGNADNVFAADCSTLYLSTDGGETWTPKPDNSSAKLWETYAPLAMAAAALEGSPAPTTPNWKQLYAVGNDLTGKGMIAFTGDEGGSWANISPASGKMSAIKAVEAHQYQGGVVWVVDKSGVWATSDYGVNWTYLNKGITRPQFGGLNAVTYAINGKLFLATTGGMLQMKPNSTVWEKVTDTGFDNENLTSLLLTDSNPRKIWVNTPDGVFWYGIDDD